MNPKRNKALLIIDMQKGSFTDSSPRYDRSGVVDRINVLAYIFRENNFPVIFIQHDGSSKNEFIPGTTEWELLDELMVEDQDYRINKYANDVFYKSSLESFIPKERIDELYITGCATDFCIESSIQSALSKDYNVVIAKDGHTTADRPHLEAKKVIDHYNWVWSNMIPTKGKTTVTSCSEIMEKLSA